MLLDYLVTSRGRRALLRLLWAERYQGNDGRGFDPAARTDGLGLRGMQERARAIGATLRIESRPAEGTEVILVRMRP